MNYIVTQIKNEKNRIKEWINYHLNVGFDKIIIYLDYPTDGSDILVKDISNKNKNVLFFYTTHGITVEYKSPNDYLGNVHVAYSIAKSYLDGLNFIKNNCQVDKDDWVAFIDVDEYIVQTGNETLNNFLLSLDPTIDRLYFTSYDMKCPIDLNYSVIEQSLYRWSDKTRNTMDKGGVIVSEGLFSSRGKSMARVYNLDKIDCCHALDFDRNKTLQRNAKCMSTGGDLLKGRNSFGVDVFHDKEYFKLFHYRNDGLLQVYDEFDDSALRAKKNMKSEI